MPAGPDLSADVYRHVVGHLQLDAERAARHDPEGLLLCRQAYYLTGFDKSSRTLQWLADMYQADQQTVRPEKGWLLTWPWLSRESCEGRGTFLAADLLALPPFQSFGFVYPLDDGCFQPEEDVADFGGSGPEELAAHVDSVKPPVRQLVVQVPGAGIPSELAGPVISVTPPAAAAVAARLASS